MLVSVKLVKRLVLAWNPDFTRFTPSEAAELAEAEKDDDPMTLDEYVNSL